MNKLITLIIAVTTVAGCGGPKVNNQTSTIETQQAAPVAISFDADSAYAFCQAQCDFGPRTMNSEAHEQCGQWIARKFQNYGLQVTEQRTTVKGFDGTPLLANNIIASYKPELQDRILICAHWDSRPWADNDPDESKHKEPVMAANDGASGVAIMLELARLLSVESLGFFDERSGKAERSDVSTASEDSLNTQHSALSTQHRHRFHLLRR